MLLVEILCYLLPILSVCTSDILEDPVNFKDCGSTGSITTADVSSCPTFPCSLVKGKETNLTVTFKIDETVTAAKPKAYGIIAGAKIPYTLPRSDGCKDSGLICPLQPGTYTYKNGLVVPAIAPAGIRLVIEFELFDQNDKAVVCLEFPAEIKDN